MRSAKYFTAAALLLGGAGTASGGIPAFAGSRHGGRGDVRYYHANSDKNISGSAAAQLVESIGSGVHLWRATGGLSVRC